MGRAGDRIGGAFMIPVTDVESELRDHPGVEDVALAGYPDGQGGELACAVIVPATTPSVTLDELRKFLTDRGMTDWYLPSRLEELSALPRNDKRQGAQGAPAALAAGRDRIACRLRNPT
jgi:cyclohexanecarboxylate-CoA ligase